MTEKPLTSRKIWLWVFRIMAGVIIAAIVLPPWVKTLLATQGAVATYYQLTTAANLQNLDAIRKLCTPRYLATHPIKAAKEGGVIGLPRNINKNFRAWREGEIALLCPSNRIGPVYQFVNQDGVWQFDGPAGLLRSNGQFVRGEDGSAEPIDLDQTP